MPNPTLIEYIKNAKAHGLAEDVIIQTLLGNGWPADEVHQSLELLQIQDQAPRPPVVPTQTPPKKRSPSVNSTYSRLLAVALFVFLIILMNRIYSDVNNYFGGDVSGRLIVNALITIPFLIIALFLHLSFGLHQPRFKILSQPYYLAAGWPLLRLLGNILKYLFDKNSAYGVYFSLLLIVLVLTATVFVVQKYFRKNL